MERTFGQNRLNTYELRKMAQRRATDEEALKRVIQLVRYKNDLAAANKRADAKRRQRPYL